MENGNRHAIVLRWGQKSQKSRTNKTNQQHDCRLLGLLGVSASWPSESLVLDIKKPNTKDAVVAAFEREYLFRMNNGWEQSFQADYLSFDGFHFARTWPTGKCTRQRKTAALTEATRRLQTEAAASPPGLHVLGWELLPPAGSLVKNTLGCASVRVCMRACTYVSRIHSPQLWISVDRCRAPCESSMFELEKFSGVK